MTTIEAESLFPNEKTIDAVAAGKMTQIHRGQQYAEEGEAVYAAARDAEEADE